MHLSTLLAVWACCATRAYAEEMLQLVQLQLEFKRPKHTPKHLPLPVDTAEEVLLIVSTGGVGTTEFMHEVGAAYKEIQSPLVINDVNDTDGLKHRPFPVLQGRQDIMSKVKKILYVHGPLLHSMLSLERRGWLADQLNKVRTDYPHYSLEYRARSKVLENVPTTLKAYTSYDEDYGQFAKHYAGYLKQCNFSVAFLDLTRKTDHVESLAAFLDLPAPILRRHLTPWRGEVVKSSRIAGTSGKLALKFDDYEEDPITYFVESEVKAKLDQWLLPVGQQLQSLGAFRIQPATCAPTNKLN